MHIAVWKALSCNTKEYAQSRNSTNILRPGALGILGYSQFCHHILRCSSFELPSLWGLTWLFAPPQDRYEPKSEGDTEVVLRGMLVR